MTEAERLLWSRLRGNQLGVHFRRQAAVGKFIVDFLSIRGRLVIELDGAQHYTEEGKENDRLRDDLLRKEGLTILRFENVEVLKSIDTVVSQIANVLESEHDRETGRDDAKSEAKTVTSPRHSPVPQSFDFAQDRGTQKARRRGR
jgi:very-short-patch-repair endonuclease